MVKKPIVFNEIDSIVADISVSSLKKDKVISGYISNLTTSNDTEGMYEQCCR